MKDIFGQAILDYQQGNYSEDIITNTSVAGEDVLPVPYLFRTYKEMPRMETMALDLSKGKVLDIGAGAGSHSLYLKNKGLDVTAIDISEGAIETCKLRGVDKAICDTIYNYPIDNKYDTILLLMNGAGMCGKLNKLADFLTHIGKYLNKGGQILLDSSDIIYIYEDENGEYWVDGSADYYGEVIFNTSYKGQESGEFNWMYVDYNTLQRCANFNGFNCELITEGEHYDYLAKLTLID